LEIALQQNQVPYHLSGGTSFFSRNEVKDVLAYLRLLINETDDNAFLRIVNVPRRKIGTSTLEALGGFANDRHCSLGQACQWISAEQLPEASLRRLREFHQWIEDLRRQAQGATGVAVVRQLIQDIDYADWLL